MRSWTPTVSGSARLATKGRPVVREAIHPANRTLLRRAAAPTIARDGRNTASAPTTTWTMAVAANSLPRVGSPLWLPDAAACTRPAPTVSNPAITTGRDDRSSSISLFSTGGGPDVDHRFGAFPPFGNS